MAMRSQLQRTFAAASFFGKARKHLNTQAPLFAFAYDHVYPASVERVANPQSDALATKEKGPWTQLSKEDKIAVYRSQFPSTMVEGEATEPELGKIVFGVTVGVSVGVVFFAFLKKYVGPEAPKTLSPEWRAAQEEKMKLYRMNPITGISSKN